MDINKFEQIGKRWIELNNEYDAIIKGYIDSPESADLNQERTSELKKMQDELYDLEVNLLEMLK